MTALASPVGLAVAESSAPRLIRVRPRPPLSAPGPRKQRIAALFDASAPEPQCAPEPTMTVVREAARPGLRIAGERFFIEIEEDVVYVRHPRWSLMGAGDSIVAAEKELRSEARELAEVMSGIPPHTLDPEAFQLYRFVLRIA